MSKTKPLPTVRCQLNAFDRDSSASHSLFIEATSVADFKAQEKKFEDAVPFRRFYTDHEVDFSDNLSLADEIDDYIREN